MLPSPAAVPVAIPGPIVEGNTAFALDLYAKLRAKPGNVFYSPYSISSALGMTSAGEAGETLAEMTKVLHLPEDQSAAHAGFDALSVLTSARSRESSSQCLTRARNHR